MSCYFAGSAIEQGPNIGRIDRWSQWNPCSEEPKWLLLSGVSDPPKDVQISDRRPRDNPGVRGGEFLSGVAHDLANMEAAVGSKLYNTVKDLYLTKSRALEHISSLFDTCKRREVKPMLYYTGHGQNGTGNWCFHDGTISIQEIVDLLPEGTSYPMIFSDACYSGHWANFCFKKNIAGFHCLAACPEYSTAVDTRGKGGDLTLFMTGKFEEGERPSTEPMYSGRNRDDFPITSGYHGLVNYGHFIKSHTQNSENILICQSMHNVHFCGCFAPSKRYSPRPAVTAFLYNGSPEVVLSALKYKLFLTSRYNIYSLTCDENIGFTIFFMKYYGTDQTFLTNTFDIQEKWTEGFKITACAARGSTFYVIMTKDTKEYKDKTQTWFTCSTRERLNSKVQEKYEEGKAITGICYSTGLKKYFVVMTETPEGQTYE
ncbi:hypothetical protein ACROYT_G040711 [Oculina patagonica]